MDLIKDYYTDTTWNHGNYMVTMVTMVTTWNTNLSKVVQHGSEQMYEGVEEARVAELHYGGHFLSDVGQEGPC